MDNDKYFEMLSDEFEKAYAVASKAREKGYDPQPYVEIKPAPDLAARVEGIMGINGLAETIRKNSDGKSRQELAFAMTALVCSSADFPADPAKRMTAAVRIGLCILTEGILVAPTEGFQGVEIHRNPDGSDYASAVYAGPIRGAGGTSAALSVALTDHARKILGIGAYKAQQKEVERYLEEIMLYHTRAARLQYLPSESDMRKIIENCPVCIDGLPTEDFEVGIHRNIKRLDADGKEQMLTNRIRGGVALVTCEGVAQKAKSVLKHTKNVGLDWSWLNEIIKVDKGSSKPSDGKKDSSVFLKELVAGRPIFAYPEHSGSFRLRYGRSRFTGIASKGFSPATMILLEGFIATGTQLKVEKPGKGCIAMPVDSIEGPFVKLEDGRAFRIDDAETARNVIGKVSKILSVGDILVTYGDFKKSNTILNPTSFVEEYWAELLRAAGYKGDIPMKPGFAQALELSLRYSVPMHPQYIYDYNDCGVDLLSRFGIALSSAKFSSQELNSLGSITFEGEDAATARQFLELACVPHTDLGKSVIVESDAAKSIAASFGLSMDGKIVSDRNREAFAAIQSSGDFSKWPIEVLSGFSPFEIRRRSVRIGARMGRPEKAKERLMAPAPNVLFPIGEYGGKERNLSKAYSIEKKKFGNSSVELEIARYRCGKGHEPLNGNYCRVHKSRAYIEKLCPKCGKRTLEDTCDSCGAHTSGGERKMVDLAMMMDEALASMGMNQMPKLLKGVKGMMNKDKSVEPLEKGILRSMNGVHIFKDGTARFDATDAPITHFYPVEIGTPVKKLLELGYDKDYKGEPLEREDQLVELKHQDVIINNNGAEFMFKISKFIDSLLQRFYGMEPFYGLDDYKGLIGHLVVSLSPHTSAGVTGRIIGFTSVNVGLAHPYTISARRRNCDGDEDTTMLLLDALINFSRSYLPTTIGGTMDAPLILTVNVHPEEVDDEVWEMETVPSYGLDFYEAANKYTMPGDVQVERVGSRLNSEAIYSNLMFSHGSSPSALNDAPKRSAYTKFKSMSEKISVQFRLMDTLCTIDRADTAKRLILSHFIPDLMGNMHSYSKQTFRCVSCNAKYRRVPLIGVCTKCGGKLVLTISKGGIEKYLNTAIDLAKRYDLEPYIKQRVQLLKEEIETVFGGVGNGVMPTKQFDLSKFM